MTQIDAALITKSDPFVGDWNVIASPSHTVGVATTICSDNLLLKFDKTVWSTFVGTALKTDRSTAVPVRVSHLFKGATNFHSDGLDFVVTRFNTSV